MMCISHLLENEKRVRFVSLSDGVLLPLAVEKRVMPHVTLMLKQRKNLLPPAITCSAEWFGQNDTGKKCVCVFAS